MIFVCAFLLAIDGDTLRCAEGPDVRLWGMNASELHASGGQEAKQALSAFNGAHAVCTQRQVGRSFGRIVASCEVNKVDLACVMIGAGYGREAVRFSRGYYREC